MRQPINVRVREPRALRAARLVLVPALLLSLACKETPATPPPVVAMVARPVASWEGRGNRTIGFMSDTGRFRVTWSARNEAPAGGGTFRLAVHSAVSGRPIQLVADHRGDGGGTADVRDDPRPYNFMIDSANVDWSITVEEFFAADAVRSAAAMEASERMREQLVAYFAGEKQGAIILLIAGVIALTTAIVLVVNRSPYVGMAIPLVLLGLAEVAIGGLLWARTDAQVATLLAELAMAPSAMARAELARMEPIMRTFGVIKITEMLVLTAGILATYAFPRSDFAFSVGAGCVAQASLLLVFDLFAERRAAHYVDLLRALSTTP
jgi:hypothetical protein